MSPSRREATALVLTLALALALPTTTGVNLSAAHAEETGAPVPPAASAAWLAALLTDGERMVSRDFDIDDVDLTLDVLLGLAAARSASVEQQRILTWFSAGVAEHVGTAASATYVATTAKAALAAMAIGADPRVIGDVDLVALLLGRVDTNGRVTDRGGLGDLSSTASQALAVLALDRAGADAATTARAAAFLAATACADGGFAAELDTDACTATIVPTALALQALAATGGHDDALAAADAALAGMLEGGMLDAAAPEGWQLGLASQALRAVGEEDAAQRLADALIDRLDGCDGQASGALLDDRDPVRATIGVLLAASGATLTTLSNAGPTAGAPLLDCTASAASEPDATQSATPGDDASAEMTEVGTGLTPVAIGLVLLALVTVAGLPVIRRLRAESDEA
jgi:hypothetical protein